MNTNLLSLIPLLQALLTSQPTNTLPTPVNIVILTNTVTLPWTNWVLTGEFRVEHGVRTDKSVMDSAGTNVERQEVVAVIYFRTNRFTVSSWSVFDTNGVKWEARPPPLGKQRE